MVYVMRSVIIVLSTLFLTIALFYLGMFLNSLLLFRLAFVYLEYCYVVLPIAYMLSYLLWRRGRKDIASIIIIVNTSLFLLGVILFCLYLAFISEY